LETIIQELASRNRNTIELFTKVMSKWERYICTAYKISEKYYREKEKHLIEIG